jgi:hypothetical protein
MEKVPVYEVDIEGTNDEGQPLGIDMFAYTAIPAIKVKGVAFEAETKQFFSDNVKYRIAAPAMIPMEIYRKADEDMGEHYVKFTEDEIEKIYSRFMENLTNRDLFNLEHNAEKKVPAYILEAWLVENPKQDKSYSTFGIECPKGTLFVVSQVTDPAYYESLVANGQVGYSVEGFLGLKMSEQKPEIKMEKKITLPDGEHKIGKMIYTVVNGEFTEVKEEEMAETAAPTEEEKPTEDAPAEEVAAAETPAPEGETSGALTDAQKAEIMALIKPMIDELTSIIAETKQLAEGEPAVEEEIKEPAKTEMSAHEKFMAFYENTIVKSETEK